MRITDGQVRFGAGDLVNHLACRYLTELNTQMAEGVLAAPGDRDPMLDLLQQRGLAHEEGYIQHLEESGCQITRIDGVGLSQTAVDATVEAMRSGSEVIVQAALVEGSWGGRADVLRRVDVPSELGDWSYEVIDTKLARETKCGAILQLSLYSDVVRVIQGKLPEFMYVVAPWTEFEPQVYRTGDYAAYYRLIMNWLEAAVTEDGQVANYPDPRQHCDICRWSRSCDARRRADDHLSLVAGISNLQMDELRGRSVDTTAILASEPLPLSWRPNRGAAASYERVREQARVQVEGRSLGDPVYETLELEDGVGLAMLPEPSPGDVFFDIEGDPFVGPGGLEYLFGYVAADDCGELQYTGLWGLSPAEEKRNFEVFVDWLMTRWANHPGMHVYHFAPYEPSALKRLMGRYGTREDEIDQILRAKLFVDLYRVVKGALRASVESYSIKELEKFFEFEREVNLRDANSALYGIAVPLELGDPDSIDHEHKETVEAYNRDDCFSTLHLRDWLEEIRSALIDDGKEIQRPDPSDAQASESLTERQEMIAELASRIAGDVPVSEEDRDGEQQARWVLANILDWHRREGKAVWWECFRLRELTAEELLDEQASLGGLKFIREAGGTARVPVHRYSYPVQENSLRGGEELKSCGGDDLGRLATVDAQNRTIDIKKMGKTSEVHPEAVFAHDIVRTDSLKESLVQIGRHVAESGIEGEGAYRVARSLLLREPPRLDCKPVRSPGETALDAALRIVRKPDFGVLPIQGPPGSGKTYTGGRLICELVRSGARVGIVANSHKVIVNLLAAAMEAADEQGIELRAVRKPGGSDNEPEDSRIIKATAYPKFFGNLAGDCQIGAGTAWLWSRTEAENTVDVLFVDEAAQMSLANVLAISHAAPNMVLLGDPQQLDQPMQGTHPDGTAVSALEHLLGGRRTIEPSRGLFLEETWRLNPEICGFTSEAFYEGKLQSRPGLDGQRIVSYGPLDGAGLRFLPVTHKANQSSSDEEAGCVGDLVDSLLEEGAKWIDKDDIERALTLDDILIIAPYNAQVFRIQERLPGARVGTVDKFQGQEAPMVIYSMTTSTPEDAPHGMEFLYSLNRLNVATSRARCVCVLVGSPELLSPECRTPRQMQLANALCLYGELAIKIALC